MNEQHIDALPPLNSNQPSDQKGAGAISLPAASPMIDPGVASTDPAGSAVPLPANLMIADDVDLIEKEWVQKAKQIVEQTKDDPYQQNEAITKVKTDYLKKRYNRDIKVSEA